MRNYRLIPKLRARLVENTPYEDIVIPDQQQRSASEQNGEVKRSLFRNLPWALEILLFIGNFN